MHHNFAKASIFMLIPLALLLTSQQRLIKELLRTWRWSRRRSEGAKSSAIIYDDGVVVMQKEWLWLRTP